MTKQRRKVRLNLEKLFDAGCRELEYGGIIAMKSNPMQENAPKVMLLTNGLDPLATSEDEFIVTESKGDCVFLKCVSTEITVQLSKTELWIATKQDNEFQVKIPGGYLLVEAVGAEGEYPGVYISFSKDGEKTYGANPITLVEYDTLKERIQTVCYKPECEEPVEILPYDPDEINEEEMEYTGATDLTNIPDSLKSTIISNHRKLMEREKER